MKWTQALSNGASLLAAALAFAACATMGGPIPISITGAQEVPPVSTSANGSGSISVKEDRTVTGSFKTQGVNVLAAHIHQAPAGQNGPVIIPLTKVSDTEWKVPDGAKLTDAQYDAFQKGQLYVNFHSAQNKGGEIRGQINAGGGASAPRSTGSGY